MNAMRFFILFFIGLGLVILGHDIYLAYRQADQGIGRAMEYFTLSDVGWLWVHYAPGSYEAVKESVSTALWESTILWLLEQTALFVVIAPALIILFYDAAARLFHWPPHDEETGDISSRNKGGLKQKGQPMQYKRK